MDEQDKLYTRGERRLRKIKELENKINKLEQENKKQKDQIDWEIEMQNQKSKPYHKLLQQNLIKALEELAAGGTNVQARAVNNLVKETFELDS